MIEYMHLLRQKVLTERGKRGLRTFGKVLEESPMFSGTKFCSGTQL